MSSTDLTHRAQVAEHAARAAGQIIMAHYGGALDIQTKSSAMDLVTQVDLASDQVIRDTLQAHFPNETLITEETFEEGQAIDLTRAWVVDPLDGTTNFAHSFPHFAVSIAYVEDGQPVVGVILDPFKRELFVGMVGQTPSKNGYPMALSPVTELDKALLATGFPYSLKTQSDGENNIDLHSRFLKCCHGVRRAGAAALDLAYVACGRLDGFWEYALAPWDIAAGMVLIQAVGGQVSGFQGEPIRLDHRRIHIVGSNGPLHKSIISLTQGEHLS